MGRRSIAAQVNSPIAATMVVVGNAFNGDARRREPAQPLSTSATSCTGAFSKHATCPTINLNLLEQEDFLDYAARTSALTSGRAAT